MPVVGNENNWVIPHRAEAALLNAAPGADTFTIPIGATNVTLSFTSATPTYSIRTQVDGATVYAVIPAGVTTVQLYTGPLGMAVGVRPSPVPEPPPPSLSMS